MRAGQAEWPMRHTGTPRFRPAPDLPRKKEGPRRVAAGLRKAPGLRAARTESRLALW